MSMVDDDELKRSLEMAMAAGSPVTALFAAAVRQRFAIFRHMSPSEPWPARDLARVKSSRPSLMVVADGPASRGISIGPGGWPIARHLANWCGFVVIHAGVPSRRQFEGLARDVHYYRRVAYIECTTSTAEDWSNAIRCPWTVIIHPKSAAANENSPPMAEARR